MVLVCKTAPGKIARHHVLNDIFWPAFGAAWIPAVKEPSGLDRQDGKRPDGLTLTHWHGGRSFVWDVTVVSPLAASYTLTEQPQTPVGLQWPIWQQPGKQRNTRPYLQHTGSSL